MYLIERNNTWFQNIKKLQELIINSDHVIIIPHANADPDALASSCTIAYLIHRLKKGINVIVAIPEGVGSECKKILEICSKNNIKMVTVKKTVIDVIKEGALCLFIDVASIEQVKILKNYINRCNKIVVIDHHTTHDYTPIPNENILQFIRLDLSSTSEIVFDIARCFNISVPKEFLEILISGILWDTKQFTHATPLTFRYVSDILELGADYHNARHLITVAKPPHAKLAKIKCILRHRAFKIILNNNEVYVGISKVGAYESDCASALISTGYDIAFVASEEESLNAIRIIYRAREDLEMLQNIDIYNDVLKRLAQKYGGGGGGHKAAGGAVINLSDTEIALKELVEVLSSLAKGKIVELEEKKVLERWY
jgi:nanoRNase/pAp phosphatase (c-di-AMP/oligoRNAs hydrolase)